MTIPKGGNFEEKRDRTVGKFFKLLFAKSVGWVNIGLSRGGA